MFDGDLTKITEANLLSFFDRKAPEDKTLEYKKEIKIDTGDDKKEFLGDISAFANSNGGTIIYGIYAKDGVPEKMDGIAIANPDSFILQIENIIRDGIKPRIDFNSALIKLTSGNFILLIRVRESFNAPHGVISGKHYKFFHRGNGGKSELDIDQLREAFIGSSTLIEKVRELRANRVFAIESGKAPIPVIGESKVIIHLIPRQAFTTSFNFSKEVIERITKDPEHKLKPIYANYSWNTPTINFDGLSSWANKDDKGRARAYSQIFRNGVIESVETMILSRERGGEMSDLIPSLTLEDEIYKFIERGIKLQREIGLNTPVYVFVTLTNTKGKTMAHDRLWHDKTSISENDLVLPEVIIDDFDADIKKSMKPVFDLVWNASGINESVYFDKDGNWNPRSF